MVERTGEWMPWVIAGAAMAAGLWTVPDAFQLNWLMEKAVTVGNVVVGILLPVIGAIILYIREREADRNNIMEMEARPTAKKSEEK